MQIFDNKQQQNQNQHKQNQQQEQFQKSNKTTLQKEEQQYNSNFNSQQQSCSQFVVQILDHNCFSISRPLRMLGPTLAKIRLIERLDYKVMTVPFFDWDRCTSFEEQVQYIKNKIDGLNQVDVIKLQ
eukprot:TRINITY_DN97991_c0_g1_i1.p3 TRINITY_DN97991_c0_g1~~TRINITY_DN97991_c0_g1_i1.p3  ORF type:complete len:127 (+),score=11.78 TRINITY_DN97991_c0_g1_i1:238-618(+)